MKSLVRFIVGLVALIALVGFDQWLFVTLFDTNYLSWYVKNGALIGLITSIVAITWGDIEVISPICYAASPITSFVIFASGRPSWKCLQTSYAKSPTWSSSKACRCHLGHSEESVADLVRSGH